MFNLHSFQKSISSRKQYILIMSEEPVGNDGEEIKLVFLPSSRIEEGLQKVGIEEEAQKFSTKIDDIVRWFRNYKIDSIELYIEGAAKTGKVLELFVSAEGKGGCKVVLKPV